MIISALVKRYEETLDVPIGWERRDPSYALDLSGEGELLGIVQLGDHSGKKRGSLALILPSTGKGRSGKNAYETAYFLCDDANFLLGLDPKKFESARKLHTSLLANADSKAARAIVAYFSNPAPELTPELQDKVDLMAKYVFQVNGKRVDYDDGGEEIRRAWGEAAAAKAASGDKILCLATGKQDIVMDLHYKIALPGITMSAQPLICMNDQTSFRSYGAKPGDPPADIGQYAAFAYASALNALLANKENHVSVGGGSTLVYWAEGDGKAEEAAFNFWMEPPKADVKGELDAEVKRIASGEFTGGMGECDPNKKFYLLCLAPNAARISVRFFYVSAFGEIIRNIRAHYERLEIVSDNRTPFRHLPPWVILSETTIKKSASDASPLLGGQLYQSIIAGVDYPLTLYQAILTRIRAGADITQTKAAVIKAVLIQNKSFHQTNSNESEVITVALNEQSNNKPYVLGRLFSVLERLQERANGTATIRGRYFTSACANPGSVFPTLLNLSMHHAEKLDNPVFFEKLKGELLFRLDDERPFPAALSLDDQGRFILGYYHQTQAFFTKKETANENKEDVNNEQ